MTNIIVIVTNIKEMNIKQKNITSLLEQTYVKEPFFFRLDQIED